MIAALSVTHATMNPWTVRLAAVLVTVVASAASVLLVAGSARAATTTQAAAPATQVVQFSSDGIHFSDSYTGQLFQGVLLVPGGSSTRSFYVRNAATEAAILNVTLADVSTTSIPLADATSISSSTAGAPGATVPVTNAHPCATLSQGLRLAPGDSIRIDNTVSLGDLTGTVGQTASVHFALRVSFSSTDAAAPVPDTCPTDYGTVDTFPDAPTTTQPATTHGSTTTPTVYHRGSAGWTIGTSVGGGTVTTPTTPVTTPEDPTTPFVTALVSNTARFYQEYDVAFWLAMSALGVFILVLVRRRRAEDQPEAPEQLEEIGTRR